VQEQRAAYLVHEFNSFLKDDPSLTLRQMADFFCQKQVLYLSSELARVISKIGMMAPAAASSHSRTAAPLKKAIKLKGKRSH